MWPRETRNIALSYGIDIFTDHYFVLSQCTRLTRQTDRQTDRKAAAIARSARVRCALKTEWEMELGMHVECILRSWMEFISMCI